jgi:hypothetical protein
MTETKHPTMKTSASFNVVQEESRYKNLATAIGKYGTAGDLTIGIYCPVATLMALKWNQEANYLVTVTNHQSSYWCVIMSLLFTIGLLGR